MVKRTDNDLRFGEIVGITEENRIFALAELETEHRERTQRTAAALGNYLQHLKRIKPDN